MFTRTCLLILATLTAFPVAAQRPDVYTIVLPPQIEQAIENGTRTITGEPGPNYWQNEVAYDLSARINEDDRSLSGSGTITYTNHSPDSLEILVLKLRQNLHKEGVVRNRPVYMTGGMTLSRLSVNETEVTESEDGPEPGEYRIDGTILTVHLREPLPPGASIELETAWEFEIPPAGDLAVRMGTDGEVYYLGYWYPQMAVYDDVYGWHAEPYMGAGEHYMDYGTYELEINVPDNWLVWASGELQNAEEVLTETTRERLAEAWESNEILHVVTADERGNATLRGASGRLTWQFDAGTEDAPVRDVAFAASPAYVWDATRARVDQDEDGEPESVLINSFYRPGTTSWERSAEFAAFSIEHLSEMLFPYPYPHMTAVEGIISGGMEYPMMTLIGGTRNDISLFAVTYHEISHMWYPMIVGSNEKAFTWMDEGLTSFNTNEGITAFFDGSAENRPEVAGWDPNREGHYRLARSGYAVPPMRHNDRFPVRGVNSLANPVGDAPRYAASYSTPAVFLHALDGMWGRERLFEAYNTYGRRWTFKHPYPYDFFNTFEDVIGEDLAWLWTPTFFRAWSVDPAIQNVTAENGTVTVVIEDRGLAPMPTPVTVTWEDGRTESQTVLVDVWLSGETSTTLTFSGAMPERVEIDPEHFLNDVNIENNVWPVENNE